MNVTYGEGDKMQETGKLIVRILQRDKDALRVLAQKQGEPVSVVVRQLLRDALEEHGLIESTKTGEMQLCQNV